MSKCINEMLACTLTGIPYSRNNDRVIHYKSITKVFYHEHTIAEINWETKEIKVNNYGWLTRSTAQRFNALFSRLFINAMCRINNYVMYFVINDVWFKADRLYTFKFDKDM